MSAIDQIGISIPDVHVDHVILHDDKIEVRMHIDEYFYPDGTGTWTTDANYMKDLEINLKMTTSLLDEEITVLAANVEVGSLHSPDTGFQKVYYVATFAPRIGFSPAAFLDTGYSGDVTILAQTSMPASNLLDNINIGSIPFTGLFGRKTSIAVIKEGEAQTRTTGYFLGASFYTGPKTQLANGRWVTGNVQDESSQFLLERNVPSMQVIDNRDIGIDATDEDINPSLSDSLFSKLHTTRDPSGLLRYVFTMNYKRAYINKSFYGPLFSQLSDRLQDRVLLWSSLRRLGLKRKRSDTGYASEPSVEVALSGEESGDRFLDVMTDFGSLKEEEFNFQKGTLFLRSFSGTDRGFEQLNAGNYEYSVDGEFQDGIYRFISFQQLDIMDAQSKLEQYIELLGRDGNTDASGAPTRSFIDETYGDVEFLNRPYIRALVALSENIYLYKNMSPARASKIIRTFRSWLSPITGNANTLGDARYIMNNLVGEINTLKSSIFAGSALDDVTAQGQTRGDLNYSFQRTWAPIDASKDFDVGLSFLSTNSLIPDDTSGGLFTLSSEQFQKRIENESTRFFKKKNVSFSIVTADGSTKPKSSAYSYLTPSSIRVDNTMYVPGSIRNKTASSSVVIESLNTGSPKGRYGLVLSRLKNSNVADIGTGALGGITITPVETEDSSGDVTEAGTDFIEALGAESYNDPITTLQVESVEDDGITITGLNGTTQIPISSDALNKIPNYFKAILSNTTLLGNEFLKIIQRSRDGDNGPYNLLLGSMAKIEALTGYAQSAGPRPLTQIGNADWVPLTPEVYRAHPNSSLFCRLTKYSDNTVGFSRSNDAAIYNHYFVIKTPASSNTLQSDIDGALTLDDLVDTFASYGIDFPSDTDTSIGSDACAALADELAMEQMAASQTTSATPTTQEEDVIMEPLAEGQIAPFDGILMDIGSADQVISERDNILKQNDSEDF